MQVMEKAFTVSLTENDVEAITAALHSAYKSLDTEAQPVMAERKKDYRVLRNAFGSLVGQSFMGKDA